MDFSGNESPHPPAPGVARALASHGGDLNRYVTPRELDSLREALSAYTGVGVEGILPGSGTDYLLNEFLGRLRGPGNLVSTHPGMLSRTTLGRYPGRGLRRIQLRPPGFSLDLSPYKGEAAIYLFDRPNDPTGQSLVSGDQIEELLKNPENRVIIDEAYSEYARETLLGLLPEYPNLGILRTLDKAFGLGGLRVSYLLVGQAMKDQIRGIDPLLNRPAIAGAVAALGDIGFMRDQVKKIREERNWLAGELETLGLKVYPSATNFLLVASEDRDLALKLRAGDLVVADVSKGWFQGHFRIGPRGRADNVLLLKGIEKSLKM